MAHNKLFSISDGVQCATCLGDVMLNRFVKRKTLRNIHTINENVLFSKKVKRNESNVVTVQMQIQMRVTTAGRQQKIGITYKVMKDHWKYFWWVPSWRCVHYAGLFDDYECFCIQCVCVPHVCSASEGQKRAHKLSPERVTDGTEPPSRCWESNWVFQKNR